MKSKKKAAITHKLVQFAPFTGDIQQGVEHWGEVLWSEDFCEAVIMMKC